MGWEGMGRARCATFEVADMMVKVKNIGHAFFTIDDFHYLSTKPC